MSKSRGKKFTLTTVVLGTSLLFGTGAVYWDRAIEAYYIYRLRNAPNYLEEIIEQREGTNARKAIHKFFRNCSFKTNNEMLFRAYIFETIWMHEGIRGEIMSGDYDNMLVGVSESGAWYRGSGKYGTHSGVGTRIFIDEDNLAFQQELYRLIGRLDGMEFKLSLYPLLKFKILRGDKVNMERADGKLPRSTEYVCFVERE